MNQTITPQKAASLGILLVALWLILLGIWNALELIVFTFREPPVSHVDVLTEVATFLIVLWKMLPLVIGLVLFRQHRALTHWFYGHAVLEERDSWHDTTVLATLLIGLLGLFLTARALNEFCDEFQILLWILSIDNKMMIATFWNTSEYPFWYLPILYPLVLGVAFVVGARQIGNLIGRAIDKSLDSPAEKEEDDS
jgi:hypothetical protein